MQKKRVINRQMLWKAARVVLLVSGLQFHGQARAATIITFDVPGSSGTFPAAINPEGVIRGSYEASFVSHGFVRAHNGTLTTFDPPGASLSTIARAITGTSWNGPRFFGLRSGAEPRASSEAANVSPAPKNKRCLVRAPKSLPAGAAQSPLIGDGERRP
jgi:Protein of unknown function (DUF2924)